MKGQNWGFSPLDPVRLRATGSRYFSALLRNNLRYGGAIRIDHVMALFRLFWIPRGLPPAMGTYVYYHDDELLAILALESVRAQALVIGEDLGTVPDWVRERLGPAGVLSYRVFYFEREHWGGWKPPAHYPAQSLAVATTHDLPTLVGYWEGADIDTRSALGLFPSEEARQAMWAERQREKSGILAALKSDGLLPSWVSDDPVCTPTMTPELVDCIHQYLARSPAWMVLTNLEDPDASAVQMEQGAPATASATGLPENLQQFVATTESLPASAPVDGAAPSGQPANDTDESAKHFQRIADQRLAENLRLQQELMEVRARATSQPAPQNEANPYDPNTNWPAWIQYEPADCSEGD